MEIFSTQFILFEILNYKVSVTELAGTIAGLLSVWFAAKNNILTWPTGIVNVICFFFIFRSAGLFSDMILQIYYFVVCIYGWYFWKKSSGGPTTNISALLSHSRMILLGVTLLCSAGLGLFMSNIHILFPSAFHQPAAFPFADTFVAVASVIANTLMARKKIECWAMWIVVDFLATFIYYQKGILLVSGEFFIFSLMAIYGLVNWAKLMKSESHKNDLTN